MNRKESKKILWNRKWQEQKVLIDLKLVSKWISGYWDQVSFKLEKKLIYIQR